MNDAVDGSEEPDPTPGGADEGAPRGDAALTSTEPAAGPAIASPPWRHSTKMVAGVAAGVALIGAVYLARHALPIVGLAGLLAFLVAPLIRVLQLRARFPKVLALLVSYLLVLVTVLLLGAVIVAGVANSFAEVDPAEAAESLQATAVDTLTAVRTLELGGYTLDLRDVVDPTIERLEEPALPDLGGTGAEGTDAEDEATEDAAASGRSGTTLTVGGGELDMLLGGLLTGAQFVGGILTTMVVTFLIALYLSADSHRFHRALLAQVPPAYVGDAARVESRIGRVWRGYLYGQLLNSLATGLLVWVALWAIGLPGAFVLGLIMALLNMIPTFGPILAAVPGVLTAIALGSTRLEWTTISFTLLVVAIYVVVVQLQANVMAPFITGQAVQMSPAAILIGVIVGFQVGGLIGTLLVVPVLGTAKEVARYVSAKLLDRDPFADPAAAAANTQVPSELST